MDTQPSNRNNWMELYIDAKLSRYKLKLGVSGGVMVQDINRAISATKQEWPIVFIESEDENKF